MSPIFMLGVNILSIYFCFWLLKPINFAKIMPYTPQQAVLLKVVLSIVVGYLLASFFIAITNWILDFPATLLGK